MDKDEFYIGYLEKAPPQVNRFMRKTVIGIIAGAAVLAILLVISQQPFYPSTFEFLQYKTFSGTFHAHPYPMLQVLRPAENGDLPAYAHYYLVNEGKFGAQGLAEEFDGRRIELEGALIYRDNQTMIEIKSGTMKAIRGAAANDETAPRSLGTFTLTGEIVDSKCFLGVMNPGSQKPHRACAVRCISGGVPPMFVVKNLMGDTTYLLLQAIDGSPANREVLDIVAEPLEITGEVLQQDDILILKADPPAYRRLIN